MGCRSAPLSSGGPIIHSLTQWHALQVQLFKVWIWFWFRECVMEMGRYVLQNLGPIATMVRFRVMVGR